MAQRSVPGSIHVRRSGNTLLIGARLVFALALAIGAKQEAAAASLNDATTIAGESSCGSGLSSPPISNASGNRAAQDSPCSTPQVSWRNAYTAVVDGTGLPLTITQSQRLGGDVVYAYKHINTGSLSPGESWRSEIDATLTGISGDSFETELRFGVFDTRRPIVLTRGGFGLERLNRWRSNSVVDIGVAISAFDGRLRYASGAAESETGLEKHYSDEPWLWALESEAGGRDYRERAGAMFQKLDAKIIDSDRLKFNINALYTNTGEAFRSYQTNMLADIYYEGESFNATAAAEAGDTAISYEKNAHADQYYAFNENTLRFERGALGVKATLSKEETRDGAEIFSSDNLMNAKLRLQLGKVFKDLPDWAPDAITLGAAQRTASKPALLHSEDAVRRSFGVGATKSGDHFSTDIYVYWNDRNDFSETGGFAAAKEFGADIVQNLNFDDWDFSIYATMSDMAKRRRFTRDGGEKLISGGISFSRRFKRLPDLRFGLDAFQYGANSVDDDFGFESQDLTLRAEADISEQLMSGLGYTINERRPYSVYLGVYSGWSLYANDALPADREQDTRVLIMLRRQR